MKNTIKQNEELGLRLWLSGTGRRLLRWEKSGLITRDQLFSILNFEKENNGKRLIRSLTGLALFAIALGVLSIVAANWMHIPGEIKVAAHLLLNAAAGFGIFKFAKENKTRWREGSVFLFFALNLTLIALIGQVYQLEGNHAAALTTWLIISTPAVMIFGKSFLNALAWTIAALLTVASNLLNLFDYYDAEDMIIFLTWFAAGLYVPLVMMAAGASAFIREHRPEWAYILFRFSMVIFALEATLGSFIWYGNAGDELTGIFTKSGSFNAGYSLMLVIFSVAIAAVYGFEWFRKQRTQKISDRTGVLFVVVSLLSASLPLIIMAGENDLIAALHFLSYWGFACWVGYRMDYSRLMNTAITLVTVRIIAVYFELFGGLMLTGFGLIFSGLITLAILKAALNFREKLIK